MRKKQVAEGVLDGGVRVNDNRFEAIFEVKMSLRSCSDVANVDSDGNEKGQGGMQRLHVSQCISVSVKRAETVARYYRSRRGRERESHEVFSDCPNSGPGMPIMPAWRQKKV